MHLLAGISVILLLGLHTVLNSAENLPNPNCAYGGNQLRCKNVHLPGNFSVSLIPADVIEIDLGDDSPNNVLGTDAKPFPSSLVRLQSVILRGFYAVGGGDIEFSALSRLLDGVKGQLTELNIFDSKLNKLESRRFKGYSRLENLSVIRSGIRDISPEAFLDMGEAGAAPPLTGLALYENALASFDWCALRPIAQKLKEFHLQSQRPGLQKIFRNCAPFTLPAIDFIDLSRNKLTTVQMAILETFPGPKNRNIKLSGNSFCPVNPDCSCCALKDLAEWAKGPNQEHLAVGLDCGPASRTNHVVLVGRDVSQAFTSLLTKCP